MQVVKVMQVSQVMQVEQVMQLIQAKLAHLWVDSLVISIQIQIHPSLLTEPDDIIDSARLQEWEGVRPCRKERSDKGIKCVNWCHRMKEWALSRLWLTSPPIGAPYLENIF